MVRLRVARNLDCVLKLAGFEIQGSVSAFSNCVRRILGRMLIVGEAKAVDRLESVRVEAWVHFGDALPPLWCSCGSGEQSNKVEESF